jgi:hypothetical protein
MELLDKEKDELFVGEDVDKEEKKDAFFTFLKDSGYEKENVLPMFEFKFKKDQEELSEAEKLKRENCRLKSHNNRLSHVNIAVIALLYGFILGAIFSRRD